MRVCQRHWSAMRRAVDERGLSGLVAKDGATAAAQMAEQLRGDDSAATFDPLMSVHWAVVNNAMRMVPEAMFYLMSGGPEDPVEAIPGRTWPRCPLCYLNTVHEIGCNGDGCDMPKVDGFDWMIGRSADDALGHARDLGLAPKVQ